MRLFCCRLVLDNRLTCVGGLPEFGFDALRVRAEKKN